MPLGRASLSVLFLGNGDVINNKKLALAVFTRYSRHKDRIEKSGLGVIRFLAAVRTCEHG